MNHPAAFIRRHKLIAILRRVEYQQLPFIAQALYDAGVRAIECTFDHKSSTCETDLCMCIDYLRDHFADRMLIGAGTVLKPMQVQIAVDSGAQMIISPGFDAAVVEKTKELGALSIPGAFTASEISAAYRAGADFVKLFPASSLGPDYVRALCAPLGHIPLLGVGGIDRRDMAAYLKAGLCGFGIGSPLLPAELLQKKDYAALSRHIAAFVQEVQI